MLKVLIHTEIFDEMNRSSLSFIEKTKQLDDNLKLLAKSSLISKLNLKSNVLIFVM